MGAGRPSKFGDLDMEQVRKVAEKGWTDKEMADFFDVCISTWDKWKAGNERFLQSLRDWKDIADDEMEMSLYQRGMGYSHPEDKVFFHEGKPVVVPTTKHYPPDSTSMIFWLKNRRRDDWRDRRETELSGKDGGPIEYSDLSDAALDMKLKALASKAGE